MTVLNGIGFLVSIWIIAALAIMLGGLTAAWADWIRDFVKITWGTWFPGPEFKHRN
jgi:hypothetical protein